MSQQITKQIVGLMTKPSRTKLLKTPENYGMKYQSLSFDSKDGTSLSAWLACQDSEKLAVITHPLYCSKYGYFPEGPVGDLVPVHVEFQKMAKHLYDEGYSILSFDFRNHGESDDSESGVSGIGAHEWKDIVGVMNYINGNENLSNQNIAFISHCMGANATIKAMSMEPELFGKVKVMTAIQPVSMKYMVEKFIFLFGGGCTVDDVDKELKRTTGLSLSDMSPMKFLNDIKVPVFVSQVRKDVLTDPIDVQTIYENIPTEKELLWVEGDLNRFDGYNYFNSNPEGLLAFVNKHMV